MVVPLDRNAEEELRANDVSNTTNVRYLGIPGDRIFELLWQIGLFREINSQCATLLDDYEEEIIEASSAARLFTVVEKIAKNSEAQQPDVAEFLEELSELVKEASTLSRPVVFVL